MPHLTGASAINYARVHGLSLSKYTDSTEGARSGGSVEEAEEVAAVDASLIYVEVPAGRRFVVENVTTAIVLLDALYGTYATALAALEAVESVVGKPEGGWSNEVVVHEYWADGDGGEFHHETPAPLV